MAGSPRGDPGSLWQLIYFQVYLKQLFFGHFWPYQLNGRYACLWVQLRQVLPVASVDDLFHLLPPFDSCIPEHFIQYDQVMGAILCPLVLEPPGTVLHP